MRWHYINYSPETEEGEITDSGSDEESDDDRVSGHLLEKLGKLFESSKQWFFFNFNLL